MPSRRPARSAVAAACARPLTPSLRKMLLTCTLAVLGLMNSSAPIWAFVRPAASNRRTAPPGWSARSSRPPAGPRRRAGLSARAAGSGPAGPACGSRPAAARAPRPAPRPPAARRPRPARRSAAPARTATRRIRRGAGSRTLPRLSPRRARRPGRRNPQDPWNQRAGPVRPPSWRARPGWWRRTGARQTVPAKGSAGSRPARSARSAPDASAAALGRAVLARTGPLGQVGAGPHPGRQQGTAEDRLAGGLQPGQHRADPGQHLIRRPRP